MGRVLEDRFVLLLLIGLLLLTGGLTLAGCQRTDSHSHVAAQPVIREFTGEYPIDVLCTTGQVAEMVRRVGGEHCQVAALMDHDIDPHLFKPKFSDVEKLDKADVIFYSGLHLEGRMADLFEQRARSRPTFAVTAGLLKRKDKRLREPPEFQGQADPHVWHDVAMWSDCVQDVADLLSKLDPPHATDYDQNAHQYRAELAQLHQTCLDEVAKIPESKRVLVTAHDAFGYFGQAYGIEVFGLKGISSEDEKDLPHQEAVQQMLIQRKIPAVFVESTIAHRTVEALIEPCRAAGWNLKNGGELYSDALGAADSDASTYTGMIEHNVQTIVKALTAASD